jgi:hypothetical protein
MGSSYGRQVLTPQIGNDLMVLANLDDAIFKPGGVTVDWTTVTAVSGTDVTLTDGNIVRVGQKGLRYGQILCQITASGLYGPYDVADTTLGRGTLVRGKCFILNQTVLENGVMPGLPTLATNHPPGVFYAGLCWLARLIIGAAAHEIGPAGPTVAAFETAFPQINYAQ